MTKLLIIFIFALSMVSCGTKSNKSDADTKTKAKLVKMTELKEKTVANIKEYNGDMYPVNEVTEITPTGGYVQQIYFKNGNKVKKGDTIVLLHDPSTEAAYYEAQGNLSKSRSGYNINKNLYNKYAALFKKQMISEEEFSGMKSKSETSTGDLKTAEGAYLRAKDNYERSKITAKIDGTVTDLDLKEHEKTEAGQKILTVIDNSQMETTIFVAGKDLATTAIGDNAELYIDELDQKFNGTISEINQNADPNSKKYAVKISVNNQDGHILKGMYAKVRIKHGDLTGLFIPKTAIMIKELYSYVAIVRDAKVMIYKIDTGVTLDNEQLIIMPDWKQGDRVVTEGQYLLNNNDTVREN